MQPDLTCLRRPCLRPPWELELAQRLERWPQGAGLTLVLEDPVHHHLDAVRLHRAVEVCASRRPDLVLSLWLTTSLRDRTWLEMLPVRLQATETPVGEVVRLSHQRDATRTTPDFRGLVPETDAELRICDAFQRAAAAESPRWTTASGSPWPIEPPQGATWLVHQARFHLGDSLWLLPLLHAVGARYRPARLLVVAPDHATPFYAAAGAKVVPFDGEATQDARGRVLQGLPAHVDVALFAFARRPESSWLMNAMAESGVPTRVNLEYFDPDLDANVCHEHATHEGWCFWNALPSPAMLTRALDPFGRDEPPPEVSWKLEVSEADREQARASSRRRGIEGDHVVLAPGGRSSQRWPEQKWSALAARFAGQGLHILVEGAPDELDLLRRVAEGAGPGTAGRIIPAADPLPEFLALLEGARLLVSNDHAAIHLAAGVGTPTLYFAHLEKLVHSHPLGASCRALWDESENDLRKISIETAWKAIQDLDLGQVVETR